MKPCCRLWLLSARMLRLMFKRSTGQRAERAPTADNILIQHAHNSQAEPSTSCAMIRWSIAAAVIGEQDAVRRRSTDIDFVCLTGILHSASCHGRSFAQEATRAAVILDRRTDDTGLTRRGDPPPPSGSPPPSLSWADPDLFWEKVVDATGGRAQPHSRSSSPTLSGWSDLVAAAHAQTQAAAAQNSAPHADHDEVNSKPLGDGKTFSVAASSAPRPKRLDTFAAGEMWLDKEGYPKMRKSGPPKGTPR